MDELMAQREQEKRATLAEIQSFNNEQGRNPKNNMEPPTPTVDL